MLLINVTTTTLEPHIAKRGSCRIKSTGDPLPRDGARHEHTSVRAGARRAARAQLRLRRRVAECVPLRLRAGICGPVEVGVGCAAPGRPATRLSGPAHAPDDKVSFPEVARNCHNKPSNCHALTSPPRHPASYHRWRARARSVSLFFLIYNNKHCHFKRRSTPHVCAVKC